MKVGVDSKKISSVWLYKPLSKYAYRGLYLIVSVYIAAAAITAAIGQDVMSSDISDDEWNEKTALIMLTFMVALMGHAILWLLRHWSVQYKCWDCFTAVSSLPEATHALVYPTARAQVEFVKITNEDGNIRFVFQESVFIWSEKLNSFEKARYPSHLPASRYYVPAHTEYDKPVYGQNTMNIPVPAFLDMFKEHAMAPFFVFQVFSVSLWILDEMWMFSLLTLFLLVIMEGMTVKSRMKNMSELRSIGVEHDAVMVLRDGKWKKILSSELVPMDIVSFLRGSNAVAPCDAVILGGTLLSNEAALTGESIPQTKTPLSTRSRDLGIDDEEPLNLKRDKRHVVFSGTSIIQSNGDASFVPRPPGGGCVCRVVRTGFGTAQGKLVKTILHATDRATSSSKEAGLFLLFLLVFALVAAVYVVMDGLASGRKQWKIALHFLQILTSVVPPELPVELSLAVNTSVIALKKLGIHCTEPFKLPAAGMIDSACFDKTGTLTADDMLLKGVVLGSDYVDDMRTLPSDVMSAIAGCQDLVNMPGKDTQGDPLEMAALKGIDFSLTKDGQVVSHHHTPKLVLEIVAKFPFSSSLRLMSTIFMQKSTPHAVAKGAPEAIYDILDPSTRPDRDAFMKTAEDYARQGGRVLAIASKPLPQGLMPRDLRAKKRDEVESNLHLIGLLVFDCPLREGSVDTIKAISESAQTIMITGDHILTACSVAKSVGLTDKPIYIAVGASSTAMSWCTIESFGGSVQQCDDVPFDSIKSVDRALCMSGDVLMKLDHSMLPLVIPHISVFARMSPQQKETVISTLTATGRTTLMCGDGTNDVGALSRSHVGVALLSAGEKKELKKEKEEKPQRRRRKDAPIQEVPAVIPKPKPTGLESWLEKLSKEAETDSSTVSVKPGDACVAAPFSSKSGDIMTVIEIVKQGRCTLATTMQMYRILSVNCLIAAYSLSIMHLQGIRQGDFQMAFTGILLAACYLFISRAKPAPLSKHKPPQHIFSAYMLLSLLGQFAIHLYALIHVMGMASIDGPRPDPEAEFEPSLMNTCVYLVAATQEVSTFLVNYSGRPHMESMLENRGLLYCIGGTVFFVLVLSSQLIPPFNIALDLVMFPSSAFTMEFMSVLVIDVTAVMVWHWLVGRVCRQY